MERQRQPEPPKYRTDWFRVLVELQHHGLMIPDIAAAIDAPQSTVKGWKYGAEPAYEAGRLLLQLWCNTTGKALVERPQALS